MAYRRIVISPYSKKLRDKPGPNPKDYPYWDDLVHILSFTSYIVQIGTEGERSIPGVDEYLFNAKLRDIENLVRECDVWIGVDNFLQHLAHYIGKPGVALYGQSDPKIFGYPENVNLLKDTKYLRDKQFDIWEACTYNKDAFVSAQEVVAALERISHDHSPQQDRKGIRLPSTKGAT